MTDSNGDESLSNLSENSFVILGHGSLPSNLNNGSLCTESTEFVSNFKGSQQVQTSALINAVSENIENKSYMEDTQEKLHQLLQENYNLRETLNQNNLAIKSQLDTFIMWQQEVLKTHETHKQKFLETKEMILKLRAENANLKKLVEENCHENLLVNGNNTQVITSIEDTKKIDGLQQEVKKFKELCNKLTDQNENLKLEKYELEKKLKESESQIFKISRELEDVLRENKFLQESSEEYKKTLLMSFSFASLPKSEAWTQVSNSNLKQQLEEEKTKVTELNGECKTSESDKTVEPKLSTTEQLKYFISNLDNMNVSINKHNERYNSILKWISTAEENLKEIKGKKSEENVDFVLNTIKALKSNIHQEEVAHKEEQENLQELHGKFYNLLEDYKELQKKLKVLETNCSNNQKYKDEITTLTEQLAAKDEILTLKQQECDQLKDITKKLTSECEEVALLRVQMEVYQTDFNDEREAREKLVGEKEEMAEQIRLLQTKIERLEKQNYNEAQDESLTSPLESTRKGKKSQYICPKCMFSFSDLQRCQQHVDECLNIHFYP